MYDQNELGMIGMLDLHALWILIAGFIQKFIARLQDMIGSRRVWYFRIICT